MKAVGPSTASRAVQLRACWCAWLLLVLLIEPVARAAEPRPYLLVEQVPGRSQLRLADEGLELLRGLRGRVAPVVVIGPYRSGKSFLLNQLLGVPCGQGFGVGHTRDTQTKGVWLWGQPQAADDAAGGGERSILYVDTEGFESTARSSSYDDRIFAVAAVLSSLLVYNLPETIRESDVAKLSFAVDLASGFYDQWKQGGGGGGSGDGKGGGVGNGKKKGSSSSSSSSGASGGGLAPAGRMLWVIQRDFLQGKGVQQLVDEALAPVPNPKHDKELAQLNRVRESLASIAGESTGYSLPQPHLDRTRLCDLADGELDPRYLKQRDGLRALVTKLARPKAVGGVDFTGGQLAALLAELVAALNEKEIPTGASLLESFNTQLVGRAMAAYTAAADAAAVPRGEAELGAALDAARDAALAEFEQHLLGRARGGELREKLLMQLARERAAKMLANTAASNDACQSLEMACTRQLASLGRMALPSMRQFEGRFGRCRAAFEARCVGPARAASAERLDLAWSAARARFGSEYNGRLLGGLVGLAVAGVVVFRFLLGWRLCELLSWLALVFLEVYPRIYPSGMYEAPWWRAAAQAWELLMAVALGDYAPLTWLAAAAAAYAAWRRRRQRRAAAARYSGGGLELGKKAGGVGGSYGALPVTMGSNGIASAAVGGGSSSSSIVSARPTASGKLRQLAGWWGGGGGKVWRNPGGATRDLDV